MGRKNRCLTLTMALLQWGSDRPEPRTHGMSTKVYTRLTFAYFLATTYMRETQMPTTNKPYGNYRTNRSGA